jgi:predicted type IV restriction endonuclease
MNIYNEEKTVLRKGNTYLIVSNPNEWIIYKKFMDACYYIRLFKEPK